MDGARPEPLTDEVLDRELAQLLAVDHSPEFVARVRERVAAEPAATVWPWRWAAIAMVTAAAAVGAMLTTVTGSHPATSPVAVASRAGELGLASQAMPHQPVSASRSGTPLPSGAPVRLAVTRPDAPQAEVGIRSTERVREVLIPADEQRAFAHLVALLGDQRVAAAVVNGARAAEDASSDVVIPPIEIAPLPAPAQQPGE